MSQNRGSFYRFFASSSCFFFLTFAEIKVFNWLKPLFFASVSKKNKYKPLKKRRFFGTYKPANFNYVVVGSFQVLAVSRLAELQQTFFYRLFTAFDNKYSISVLSTSYMQLTKWTQGKIKFVYCFTMFKM